MIDEIKKALKEGATFKIENKKNGHIFIIENYMFRDLNGEYPGGITYSLSEYYTDEQTGERMYKVELFDDIERMYELHVLGRVTND